MQPPRIRHTLNLWSIQGYPSKENDWNLEQKLEAIKESGFDAITTNLTSEHRKFCEKLGLDMIGFISTGDPKAFKDLVQAQRDQGARHINVQLADEDTPVEVSTGMAIKIIEYGKAVGADVAVEVHRDTCTETPEKTYAIADAYQKITGELMPIVWDFSHLAVVKHIYPPFEKRLLLRPDLIQRPEQVHLRPFNGHHCQVPVTDGKGGLTPEVKDWLGFAEAYFAMWLAGDQKGRELYTVPEMGPHGSGYNLSSLPNSWEDAKVLRVELDRIWKKVFAESQCA